MLRPHKRLDEVEVWVEQQNGPRRPVNAGVLVERRRIELPTFALRTRRSPS